MQQTFLFYTTQPASQSAIWLFPPLEIQFGEIFTTELKAAIEMRVWERKFIFVDYKSNCRRWRENLKNDESALCWCKIIIMSKRETERESESQPQIVNFNYTWRQFWLMRIKREQSWMQWKTEYWTHFRFGSKVFQMFCCLFQIDCHLRCVTIW